MNKKGKLTILTFAFAFLAFALVYYAFYIIPHSGTSNSSGGTGTFWGRYGYSPPSGNNLSLIGGTQKESNVTSVLQNIECSLTTIGDSSGSEDCPKPSAWSTLTNFGSSMVLGAYQSLVAFVSIFGGFKVLITQLALLIGISPEIVNILIGGIALAVFVSIILLIFNKWVD